MNNRFTYIFFAISLLFLVGSLQAQIVNDECIFATHLGNISEYCSGDGELTTAGATLSLEGDENCFLGNPNNDVWFSFVPTAPGVFLQLFGSGFDGNSLNNPALALYGGDCNNLIELACNSVSPTASINIVELIQTNITIGQVYYLRVDSRLDQEGTFTLCIESFIPIPSPESDCPEAVVLCDKSPFVVENLSSTGNIQNELIGSCVNTFEQSAESASAWYVWTCETSGTLEFTITPNSPNNDEEDIDFVVYEMPNGINDCAGRFSVRCMLSGETDGLASSPCYGPTGLSAGETDIEEFAGCNGSSNNFVAPLDMEAGKSYGLIINNFSESGFGFSIDFGGTGTFLGPQVDFDVTALNEFECDKTITFTNQSDSSTDPIAEYFWSFGVGADPATSTEEGPVEVTYESFGEKVAALTVISSRGCSVTEIKSFFIEPCCQDTSTLMVNGLAQSVACFGEENGTILGDGSGGVPQYQFSLEDGPFQPSPLFNGLASGEYELTIQDIKGCEDSIILEIPEPVEINVFTIPDTTITLGDSVQLNSFYTPEDLVLGVQWTPENGLDCNDCLDPWSTSPGTTTYTITVTDIAGCTAQAQVTVTVDTERPYYDPNVFTPGINTDNNYFTVFFKESTIDQFVTLRVYDRWGELIYEGQDLDVNNPSSGWDGTFNGELVQSGVYSWIASVRYIDDVTENYTGTITVIR